jgi:transcriptional regulator with XRE-family HTH domain
LVSSGPPPSEGQRGLAKAVNELRKQAKLSQSDLAERAGLAEPLIALIESGRYDPTWGDIRRIAKALGVSLEAFSEAAEQHELDREV